jgi:hypothetical protein
MLHELEKDPESRGMYIFPTKALAQDQRRSMMDPELVDVDTITLWPSYRWLIASV